MGVIILGSTLALRSALAQAARRQWADTSDSRNPREGPIRVTACLMAVEILSGVTGFHELCTKTKDYGVRGEALSWRKEITMQTEIRTGQRTGSPLSPRPMASPPTPFFVGQRLRKQTLHNEVVHLRQWFGQGSNHWGRVEHFKNQRVGCLWGMLCIYQGVKERKRQDLRYYQPQTG